MPGLSRAGQKTRRLLSQNPWHLVALFAIGFVVAASVSDCGFPDYAFHSAGQAGAVSSGGMGTGGAEGGGGGVGGVAGANTGGTTAGGASESGAGGISAAGAAGEAGAAGAATVPCVFPEPSTFPRHCSDGLLGTGETGVDCGDECPACSRAQACNTNSDCTSAVCSKKVCVPVLSVSYRDIVGVAITKQLNFTITVKLAAAQQIPLQSLRIRYYFNRNSVAEPLLTLSPQATFDPGGAQRGIASQVQWRVYRLPTAPAALKGSKTDAYLEITFTGDTMLTPSSTLTVTQDITAGSNSPQFDQTTHYSYMGGANPAENDTIAVYNDAQLVWGVPPPLLELPACAFVAAVNLNGPAVSVGNTSLTGPAASVGSESFQASAAAGVTYTGPLYSSATSVAYPPTDADTTKVLRTAFTLGSASAKWPVADGKYWAYVWLTSAAGMDVGTLGIQDQSATFNSVQVNNTVGVGSGWARTGPYAITVADSNVTLGASSGKVNVAAVELFRVAP